MTNKIRIYVASGVIVFGLVLLAFFVRLLMNNPGAVIQNGVAISRSGSNDLAVARSGTGQDPARTSASSRASEDPQNGRDFAAQVFRILDSAGNPLLSGCVTVAWGAEKNALTAKADVNGNCVVSIPLGITVFGVASADGFGVQRLEVTRDSASDGKEIVIRLSPARTISGVVVCGEKRIANIEVRAFRIDQPVRSEQVLLERAVNSNHLAAMSDANGEFTIHNCESGRNYILVGAGGCFASPFPASYRSADPERAVVNVNRVLGALVRYRDRTRGELFPNQGFYGVPAFVSTLKGQKNEDSQARKELSELPSGTRHGQAGGRAAPIAPTSLQAALLGLGVRRGTPKYHERHVLYAISDSEVKGASASIRTTIPGYGEIRSDVELTPVDRGLNITEVECSARTSEFGQLEVMIKLPRAHSRVFVEMSRLQSPLRISLREEGSPVRLDAELGFFGEDEEVIQSFTLPYGRYECSLIHPSGIQLGEPMALEVGPQLSRTTIDFRSLFEGLGVLEFQLRLNDEKFTGQASVKLQTPDGRISSNIAFMGPPYVISLIPPGVYRIGVTPILGDSYIEPTRRTITIDPSGREVVELSVASSGTERR